MFEVVILIPIVDNDGDVFPASVHEAFEAAALDFFGGVTRLPIEAAGAWLSDAGVTYRDATHVYIVAVASLANGDRVVALVRFAKALYCQEAIFIRYLGVVEIIT